MKVIMSDLEKIKIEQAVLDALQKYNKEYFSEESNLEKIVSDCSEKIKLIIEGE